MDPYRENQISITKISLSKRFINQLDKTFTNYSGLIFIILAIGVVFTAINFLDRSLHKYEVENKMMIANALTESNIKKSKELDLKEQKLNERIQNIEDFLKISSIVEKNNNTDYTVQQLEKLKK